MRIVSFEDVVNIIMVMVMYFLYAKKDTTSFIQLVGRGANFGLNTFGLILI
jgi:hypothetical protein